MQLLQVDDTWYGNYVMQQAAAYLEAFPGAAYISQELQTDPLFWAWWRNHWFDRDSAFIDHAKHLNLNERREYYQITHDTAQIIYVPQAPVLSKAFKTAKKHTLKAF